MTDRDEIFGTLVDLMAEAVVSDRFSDDELARHRELQDLPDDVWKAAREGDKAAVSDEMCDALTELAKPAHRALLLAYLEHVDVR